MRSSAETGGVFINEINRLSSEFRDRYMVEVIAREARCGERVFAVVGRDYVPAQASALRCVLREPRTSPGLSARSIPAPPTSGSRPAPARPLGDGPALVRRHAGHQLAQ